MVEEKNKPEPIEIPLGNSYLFAWIDEEDKELLREDWELLSSGTKNFPQFYAVYRQTINRVTTTHFLHNEVWENMMGTPVPPGFLIDHINGDKLDNRRSNLRLADRTLNEANKKKRRSQRNQKGGQPTSNYKGVSKIKYRKKCWRATITVNGNSIALGTFYDEKEAAKAYNDAAIKHFGDFASLNDLEDVEDDSVKLEVEE